MNAFLIADQSVLRFVMNITWEMQILMETDQLTEGIGKVMSCCPEPGGAASCAI